MKQISQESVLNRTFLLWQVISAFEKLDFHVITSIWTMDKTVIISILEFILLRSRGNAKKVKIFQRIFHPAVDYVF